MIQYGVYGGKRNMRNKILVVDDSKFNRRMLRDEFEADYEIVEAENGLEAL